MIIVVLFLVISILLGIAGSIILTLGIINKKTIAIVLGGILLFFTVLFSAGSVGMSAMHHRSMMMPGECPHHMKDGCCGKEQMKACCKYDKDSDSTKMDAKKMGPEK